MKERKKYTEQELGRFLRENKISPTEAVDINTFEDFIIANSIFNNLKKLNK